MVEKFVTKLRNINYLLESDAVQLFMDPRLTQSELDYRLGQLVKSTTSQADALNRFKECFNQLSGKEVDQRTFQRINDFKIFILDIQKLLTKFKSAIEKAMTNKVEYDNSKMNMLTAMCDIEQLLQTDLDHEPNKYKMRAQQRVLASYREVNSDKHWRALETIDDFVRD